MDGQVKRLVERGVAITHPMTVDIGGDIDPDMISPGVTIHGGCRISGKKTVIMAGAVLGEEAPVTVRDCQIGTDVSLKGGFFQNSVFLDKANMGSGAHVREACILEEEAGGAHAVGLKHTILLPFVTLGSIINFCDCLMAGGTSRKNHSEVGSSYIHFNYSPNQDKATPSLMGDVPRGVMLAERPIFLGGQGGIVGPSIIAYGTVIAAGTVVRDDIREEGKLVLDQFPKPEVRNFHPGIYWSTKRLVRNNVTYMANLIALKAWYRLVRSQFFGADSQGQALLKGSLEKLDMALDERIWRLGALAAKMKESIHLYSALMMEGVNPALIRQKQELFDNRQGVEECLRGAGDYTGEESLRDDFLAEFITGSSGKAGGYVRTIQALDPPTRCSGILWLEGIVRHVEGSVYSLIPSYKASV